MARSRTKVLSSVWRRRAGSAGAAGGMNGDSRWREGVPRDVAYKVWHVQHVGREGGGKGCAALDER